MLWFRLCSNVFVWWMVVSFCLLYLMGSGVGILVFKVICSWLGWCVVVVINLFLGLGIVVVVFSSNVVFIIDCVIGLLMFSFC